jgi:hypothetical protein
MPTGILRDPDRSVSPETSTLYPTGQAVMTVAGHGGWAPDNASPVTRATVSGTPCARSRA